MLIRTDTNDKELPEPLKASGGPGKSISPEPAPSHRPWASARARPLAEIEARVIGGEAVRSQGGLGGGIQQDRLIDRLRLACGGQTQGGGSEFVDLARNAFGRRIESLPGGVVEQRLGYAGGLELLRQVLIQFLAREPFQMIVRADALT